MPDDESIRMMARLIIAPAGGCIRTRQIGKCAAKHRRPPFAPCCHAAFETASQIGITDPVGRWSAWGIAARNLRWLHAIGLENERPASITTTCRSQAGDG